MNTFWSEIGRVALELARVFYTIVLPMLLLASVGFILRRRMTLDMPTLSRLNFHFVIPAMVYYAVVSSSLSVADVGRAVGFALALMALMAEVTLLAARLRGVPPAQRRALLLTTLYYNAGNYGLPLQDLAFRPAGLSTAAMTLQSFVMLTQNFMTFTLGVFIAGTGHGNRHWREHLAQTLRFTPLYALAAGVLTVLLRRALPASALPFFEFAGAPFWKALLFVKEAFIGLALCTLGAQLAGVRHDPVTREPVKLSLLLRLLGGPLLALALVKLFGLHGFVAQVLIIGTATPTAVNAMLLALEFDNHADYVARTVFYSTLLSPLTVTLVIVLTRGGWLD